MRLPGLVAWSVALGVCACHAGVGAGPPPPTAGDFTIAERAETGPVTALAAKAPYLWAAGAPGLRRWDVTTGDYDVVGDGDSKGTHALTALAVDDEGSAWVASGEEVGRWVVGKAAGGKEAGKETGKEGELTYETAGSPGDVVALAPRRPVKTKGVWAGGPGGAVRYDGHRWAIVEGLPGVAVSWIGLAADGTTAWVGTRDKGLYQADDRGATPAPGGAAIGCEQLVGMATTAAGTRVAVGNVNGDARLYALTLAGTVELHAPVGIHAVALVERGSEALLIAGPVGHEQAYALSALDPGEPVPLGGLRFTEVGTDIAHWAGAPVDIAVPRAVTAAAAIGGDLYLGSVALGVARAEAARPHFLGGSELVGDADRFTIACRAHDHCLIVTDGPQAWQTDGDRYVKTGVGEAADAVVLAVAADREGNTFALSAGPTFRGLVVTRRSVGSNDWTPVARAALVIGIDSNPKRLEVARRMGADVVLNFKEQDVVAEIKRLTGGGVDVAIEALGRQQTFEAALRVLRPGGTLSSLGVYSSDLRIPLDAFLAGLGDHTIVTTLCPGSKERMRRLMEVIASSRLDTRPLVTHRFRLDQIEQAYELFANQRDGVLKVAISP